MSNKKIKNTKPVTVKNIKFKSTTESKIYNFLLSKTPEVTYEEAPITIFSGYFPKVPFFKGKNFIYSRIRNITYTPDFTVKYKGFLIYIEVKGWINDVYPYKRKLFRNYLESLFIQGVSNIIFAEIKSVEECQELFNKIDVNETNF